jgi:hypothetical protein
MTISESIVLEARDNTRAAFDQMSNDAKKATGDITKNFDDLNGKTKDVGIGLTAVGAVGGALVTSSVLLAARVQTLGVVMNQVGKNAGYSSDEMAGYEEKVKALGITTQATREGLTQMARGNLDLAKSTDLAREAQDAAVNAGINSSEAFHQMVYGIETLNPRVLKTMGIIVDLQSEYQKYADKMGIATTDISEQTQQQIMFNAVLEAGKSIAGSYEAAMGTAGKQMNSLARLTEEAQLAIGDGLLPAFSGMIGLASDALKGFNALNQGTKEFVGQTLALGSGLTLATGGLILLIPRVYEGVQTIRAISAASRTASIAIEAMGASEAAATLGTSTLGVAVVAALGPLALAVTAVGALALAFTYAAEQDKKAQDAQEAVVTAFDRQSTEAKTAGYSYEQYTQKVRDAATAQGLMIDASGDLIKVNKQSNVYAQVAIEKHALLTQTEFEEVKATLAAASSFHDLAGAHEADRDAFSAWYLAGAKAATTLKEMPPLLQAWLTATDGVTYSVNLQKQAVYEEYTAWKKSQDAATEWAAALKAATNIDFSNIDTGLENTIKTFLDTQKYFISGGAVLQEEFNQIGLALANKLISPGQATAAYKPLYTEALALKVKLGEMNIGDAIKASMAEVGGTWAQNNQKIQVDIAGLAVAAGEISFDSAAKNLALTLGISLTKAKGLLTDLQNQAAAGASFAITAKINFSTEGLTGSSGAGANWFTYLRTGKMPGQTTQTATVSVGADTSAAKTAIDAIIGTAIPDKAVKVTAPNAGEVQKSLNGINSTLLSDKSFTVTTYHRDVYESAGTNKKGSGGAFPAGWSGQINENPMTRPETVVFSQPGYVLTKQDAQAAVAGRSGGKGERVTTINHNYINDPVSARMFLEQQRRDKLAVIEGRL